MVANNEDKVTNYKQILVGIVGSHAYGLNTPNSDIDFRGIFVVPTEEILGIFTVPETIDRVNPDICLHEVRKFLGLALSGNPNILEMLYLEQYPTLTQEGKLLIENREAFLSQRVRDSYCGYAMSQIKRLRGRASKGDASFSSDLRKRYSKHARHCFRLLIQGNEILTTGNLTVRLTDPDYLFWIGEQSPEKLEEHFLVEYNKVKTTDSILPKEPDRVKINEVLLQIREMNTNRG